MAKRVILVGRNLVADHNFHKRLAGRGAAVEAQMVLADLLLSLASLVPENSPGNDNEAYLVEKDDLTTPTLPDPEKYFCNIGQLALDPNNYPRDELKITLKIFLPDFSVTSQQSLRAAVEASLRQLGRKRVDLLFLATPVEAIALLARDSEAGGPGQQEVTQLLLGLWREVEQLIGEGKVGGAGLCDLPPPVFISIYQEAAVKPTSVQVTGGLQEHWECQDVDNWQSCEAVPEELRYFAKNNGVTLLANWDPVDMLPGDWRGDMGYPGRDREEGQHSKTWVARYQVHLKDRFVLLQKRYLIELAK